MRLTGSDQKEIFEKYINLNEAGAVTNMGTAAPGGNGQTPGKEYVRYSDVGNQSIKNAPGVPPGKRSSMAALHQSSTPSTNPVEQSNEEEMCSREAIDMAKGQLLSLADKSIDLFEHIHAGDTQLEPWVASKILLASDYIETVYEYLKYNQPNQEHCDQVVPDIRVVEVETEKTPN